ncbi:MAG: GNAT family N-acetyltransferase [Phycisphaeraceae bacterium]
MIEAPRIRPANNADCQAVRALVFAVLAEYGLAPAPGTTDADLADLEQAYAVGGGAFDVLITPRGDIVGCIGLYRLSSHTCELRKMYLSPAFRGLGLGKMLAQHALTRARELGFGRVELETASVLHQAIGLYRALGFRPLERDHLAGRCDQAMYLDLGGE